MAEKAEGLLVSSGWLPEPPRTPGRQLFSPVERKDVDVTDAQSDSLADELGGQSAADGRESAMGDTDDIADDDEVAEADAPFAYAAE
jgi:ParB family chromosome partitioning protein